MSSRRCCVVKHDRLVSRERPFAIEVPFDHMPRISAAHEQQVRDRIISAAVTVFSEKGYHRATIADVVERSGLSVGAIYTHFRNKEELFLHSCDLISGQGLDELGLRLAPLTSSADRLRAAVAYYVET